MREKINELYRELEYLLKAAESNSQGNGYDRIWAKSEAAEAKEIWKQINDLENNLSVPVLAEPNTISGGDADTRKSGPVCVGGEVLESTATRKRTIPTSSGAQKPL
jgi:hypothetical protein